MTGFAVTGTIYDTANVGENVKAFRALSIILMVSRLALVIQYGIVLLYLESYRKALAPLLSKMVTLFVAAMIFFGTFWGCDLSNAGESFPVLQGGPKTYLAYYIVVCVEATAVTTICCIWRVVSVKHTLLLASPVERTCLLSLIIMGEGIIGMTKSVSNILQGSTSTSASDIGTIISAVLIYFIWVLHFDQVDHDRFGTIRQQIWAILHFPLHVAILLTVDGRTVLILWNIIIANDTNGGHTSPLTGPLSRTTHPTTFGNYFTSAEETVEWLEAAEGNISTAFKPGGGAAEEEYDFQRNFTSILNLNEAFTTPARNEATGAIVLNIWIAVENFTFENFAVDVPENSNRAPATPEEGSEAKGAESYNKNESLWRIFSTVFVYFCIAAGFVLAILTELFWFGKTKEE